MRGKLAHWRRRQTARLLPTNSTIERDDGDYRAQQNGKAPHLRAFQEQLGGYVIEAEILRSRFGYRARRSEEHTSELQSLMRISYAVFCLKNKKSKSIYLRTSSD